MLALLQANELSAGVIESNLPFSSSSFNESGHPTTRVFYLQRRACRTYNLAEKAKPVNYFSAKAS